jgi:hypothetical protein
MHHGHDHGHDHEEDEHLRGRKLAPNENANANAFDNSHFPAPAKDIKFKGKNGVMQDGSRCGSREPGPSQVRRMEEEVKAWMEENPDHHRILQTKTVTIPVAFHVIYHSDGRGNISDTMIADQISVLNAAFQPHGFAFTLSSTDRTVSDSWYTDCYNQESAMKNALKKDIKTYLNIYTCSPSGGTLGWAYFPGSPSDTASNSYLAGVCLLDESLPGGTASPYNLGDTATHEVGHFLGLYHTFQGGCAKSTTSGGDLVSDTPAEKSPAFGCPKNRNTCSSSGADPIKNFMDYTDDYCMDHFTSGQKTRMHAMTSKYRPTMYKPL